ncbi:hypothetical protein [Helicobacter sp. 23-1045]
MKTNNKSNIFKRICHWYRWNIYYKLPDWLFYSPSFFVYDLGLTLTGRQRGVEYVESYLDKIALALHKIAIYDESNREQRIAQWVAEANIYLNNIHCKCDNLNSGISHTSMYRKRLRFKDYVYVLRYLRISDAKYELENEGLENTWESVNLDGLTIKEQREKILAMYRIKPKKIQIRKWEHKELHEVIYNLLKWEFREMANGCGFYFGISDENPYYQQILDKKPLNLFAKHKV